jgi:hypothetical protein
MVLIYKERMKGRMRNKCIINKPNKKGIEKEKKNEAVKK